MTASEIEPRNDLTIPKLWQHSNPQSTQLYKFKSHIESKYSVRFGDETTKNSLYQWSIDNIALFWAEVWDFTKIRSSKSYDEVVDENAPIFPRPSFFKGARLNYAENLLFPQSVTDEDSIAVIEATEASREFVSWKELRDRVHQCQAAMRQAGVKEGDRVASFVGNHTNSLVSFLATASLGAIWTATSPDVGPVAVLERFHQISPVMLFADNAVLYNGKTHDNLAKVRQVVSGMESLKHVVIFQHMKDHPTDISTIGEEGCECQIHLYNEFLNLSPKTTRLEFTQLPADHPLVILYSSGTTGKPKCIIHGHIGTLIKHKCEHQLLSDMTVGDIFFQFTTVAWMMYEYLVSALASGTTVVLYDGSPFRPMIEGNGDLAMPKLIDELGVTCFGTSAKYLSTLEQNKALPKQKYPLRKLRAIYSTGSVLAPSTFEYVYDAFGPDINLGSITGGTDIISLFGSPSPLVPVYSGEIQCKALGMAIEAWDVDGKSVEDEPGDLVCLKAFPCMPVGFFGPKGEETYRKSYFERFPGVWHHGDFININSKTRGLLMLGRSDNILKPSGVRFGSAEIYNVLLSRFPYQFDDALCVGRRRPDDLDETVVLFLKMAPGYELSPELIKDVKDNIRKDLSNRHVPAIIDETKDIPTTTNGKKIEVAVKQILCGMNIKTSGSVANPECLEFYKQWAATH